MAVLATLTMLPVAAVTGGADAATASPGPLTARTNQASRTALAKPASPVRFKAGASATQAHGRAFDTCTAPSLRAMTAWRRSRFRAVGIYISGGERSCAQPELSHSWVRRVSRRGWRLLPIHLGLQAPCTTRAHSKKIRPAIAARQGGKAAEHAMKNARRLGLRPGSALYVDVENYRLGRPRCRRAVLRFVSGWTKRLHHGSYLSGVYANLSSGVIDLSRAHDSTRYARPDALWIARWDGSRALFGVDSVANRKWRNHQRAKQYRGGHTERHGGVAINIDSDMLDAPVATVLRRFSIKTRSVRARPAPTRHRRGVRSLARGHRVGVVCQASGQRVAGTRVWDKLARGVYVPDAFVSTRPDTGFSRAIPRCTYPRQVRGSGRAALRTRPTTSSAVVRRVPGGSLARVVCQRRGERVGSTRVWNRLRHGGWVTDRALAGSGTSGFADAVPRC